MIKTRRGAQWPGKMKAKKFWESRLSSHPKVDSGLVNLEDDPVLAAIKEKEEIEALRNILNLNADMTLLDLGAGYGQWSLLFAQDVASVTAVDYVEALLEKGRERALDAGIGNIDFINCEAEKFYPAKQWDRVLISGMLLYMDDEQAESVSAIATKVCKPGGYIVLREATSILEDRYSFIDRWSPKLNTFYSAIYRTASELKELFISKGCAAVEDRDLYSSGSPLNKWRETRMRLYSFRK